MKFTLRAHKWFLDSLPVAQDCIFYQVTKYLGGDSCVPWTVARDSLLVSLIPAQPAFGDVLEVSQAGSFHAPVMLRSKPDLPPPPSPALPRLKLRGMATWCPCPGGGGVEGASALQRESAGGLLVFVIYHCALNVQAK